MAKKEKTSKKLRFNKQGIKQTILGVFQENPSKLFNYKQIASAIGAKNDQELLLINVSLQELTESAILSEVERGRFKLKAQLGVVFGSVEIDSKGYGKLKCDEFADPIFISSSNLNHALDGDKVKARLFARRKRSQPEAEILEVIERSNASIVGTLEISSFNAFLIPSKRMPFDLFIPKDKLQGALHGQKAIARIIDWPEKAKSPIAEIIDVLGFPGNNDTEMHAILAEYDLPYRYPENVVKAAEEIDSKISESEISKRRDFRGTVTFTIDPADAKDFDDAISFKMLKPGRYEVGVHIADVTHYVADKSIIESEALNRATSVYLVDRVVPMLPERLSNDLCSLRPHEDKLCYSAVFELDENGDVLQQWFGRTIIHSVRRFSYEEAQTVIETGNGDLSEELAILNRLAEKMRSNRFEKGSIGFDRVEVKFEIDESGKPLRVFFKEAKEANKLIEEFMLLANRRVAEFIGDVDDKKTAKTFVYRIHDKPDPDKLDSFNHFIKRFGYGIMTNNAVTVSRSMNKLIENINGKKEQNVIETLAIRTMAKAEYSTRNIGHYGLGFDFYTHFTSPIRRYPDMMVHRLLDQYLKGSKSVDANFYEDLCKHSSEMEARAANAERSSIKYKQVEFMSDKIGQKFSGVISGVTDWGIYVELDENKCEGMIPIHELTDDYYEFDEKNYCLIGRRSHRRYQLGDPLEVEIARANLERKQLDFRLVENSKPFAAFEKKRKRR